MLPDRVSNPGPLTYESGALPIALRGPALFACDTTSCHNDHLCQIIFKSHHAIQCYGPHKQVSLKPMHKVLVPIVTLILT